MSMTRLNLPFWSCPLRFEGDQEGETFTTESISKDRTVSKADVRMLKKEKQKQKPLSTIIMSVIKYLA